MAGGLSGRPERGRRSTKTATAYRPDEKQQRCLFGRVQVGSCRPCFWQDCAFHPFPRTAQGKGCRHRRSRYRTRPPTCGARCASEGAAAGEHAGPGCRDRRLIEQRGEAFREYRRRDFIGNAGIFIGVIAGLVCCCSISCAAGSISPGTFGQARQRFADFERTLHWFTAIVFIFLALTGLTLLFGRFVVLPVFGAEAFGVIASACRKATTCSARCSSFAVVLLFIRFAWRNLPSRGDLTWLVKGGGIIGKAHVSAGFFNAGEKIWFWSVIVLALTVSVSGLVLIFPVLGQPARSCSLA